VHNFRRAVIASIAVLASAACVERAQPNANDGPAGSWEATRLTTIASGAPSDELAKGGGIELVLRPDGTTAGRVRIGDVLDADLTGTWTMSGSTVSFNHQADTFLRDMSFELEGATMVGDSPTFDGTRIEVTLGRVEGL